MRSIFGPTAFCLLIVVTNPYKDIEYDKINVYHIRAEQPEDDSEEQEEIDFSDESLYDEEKKDFRLLNLIMGK